MEVVKRSDEVEGGVRGRELGPSELPLCQLDFKTSSSD